MRKYFVDNDYGCLSLSRKDAPCVSLAFLSIVLLSACGGGGGGGGSSGGGGATPVVHHSPAYTYINAAQYRSTEYDAQWGLEAIHAAESYAYLAANGKTNAGAGVIIAVTDTGIQLDHPDLVGNTNGDLDHYNTLLAGESHGTHVAGIAAATKDDAGMQGVAYNADILAVKMIGDNPPGDDYGFSYAADNGAQVINASWAFANIHNDEITTTVGSFTYNLYKNVINDDFLAAKAQDALMVIATGNDAHVNNVALPALFAQDADYSGYVIAVASVDEDLQISNFSNRCSQVANYCLVAPGRDIYSSVPTGTYDLFNGTSMAAPHVSGAAAVLRGAWPFLTAPQVSNILLTTATDLGTVGTDAVYGHGILNLFEAVQAQGTNAFAYGASVSQASYDVRYSSFATDPIFGDAFARNVAPALANTVFFDDYGRDYKAFLDRKITTKNNNSIVSNLNGILLNNYKTNNVPLSFTANKAEGISTQIRMQVRSYANDLAARFSNLDRSLEDKTLTASNGFSFAQNVNSNNRIAFSFNVDEITNSYSDKFKNIGFISINSIAANPYQSFIGSASQNLQVAQNSQKNFNQLFFEHKLFDEKLKMNFSYQSSYQGSSIAVSKSAQQNQIMDVNLAYNPDAKTNLMLSFGNLNEFNNNFLNSQAVGAFEAGSDAKTSYTKIALNRELFANLSLMASYSEGITKAAGNNVGIFRDYQNIKSRSMSLGLMAEKVLGGRFGVLYSEPLRVYSGKATIDIPVARDDAGNITRYRADISLRPQGKQQNLEMVYGRDVGINAQLNFNFMVSKDVANIKGNNARLGMLIYRLRF